MPSTFSPCRRLPRLHRSSFGIPHALIQGNARHQKGDRESFSQKVDDFASEAKDKVFDAAQSASESASKGLNNAATVIKDAAGKFGGQASDAARKIAKGVESTSSYIQDHSIGQMGDDLMNVCKKYPAQAMLSSLVIGILVGRALRR
jgi:ElaB/YqjD/DUF883 family membrane-anchored ribosome-binding protein